MNRPFFCTLALVLFSVVSVCQAEKPAELSKVRLKTNNGDIVIQLDAEKAPVTVANFKKYVKAGHYNGTVFHRIIDGFMIQGGGFAKEGEKFVEKKTGAGIVNEGQNGLKNEVGTIAMARTSDPNSATAQFFINVVNNEGLNFPSNGGYAVFGKVIAGMDVVNQIKAVKTGVKELVNLDSSSGKLVPAPSRDVPLEPVIIETATLEQGLTLLAMQLWLCPVLAFLLGSIPFGLLIAKAKGIDIRLQGSGNIGATNVFRIVGKKYGISCLLLDALKGFVPVVIAISVIQFEGMKNPMSMNAFAAYAHDFSMPTAQIFQVLTGLCAVLGHNYTPWAGFKGGKGIATSAGVFVALMPAAIVILIVIWVLVFLISRYVSLASIIAAAALPLVTLWGSWFHGKIQNGTWNKPLFVFTVILAVLAIWKHRSNIMRLRNGTEHRFTRKPKSSDV